MSWEQFEEKVKEILEKDDTKRIPGSGNAKKEEDVVGRYTISQCKYTEQTTITVLPRDVDRLISAAKTLEKFPLFFSKAKGIELMSLVVDHDPLMCGFVVDYIIASSGLDKLLEDTKRCNDPRTLALIKTEKKKVFKAIRCLLNDLDHRVQRLDTAVEVKTDDLLQYDLFRDAEGENGA